MREKKTIWKRGRVLFLTCMFLVACLLLTSCNAVFSRIAQGLEEAKPGGETESFVEQGSADTSVPTETSAPVETSATTKTQEPEIPATEMTEPPTPQVKDYSTDAEVGDIVRVQVYYIEPNYSIRPKNVVVSISDLSTKDYVCKISLNPEHTEETYIFVSGPDYCEFFSGTTSNVNPQEYVPPVDLIAQVVLSETVVSGLEEAIGNKKALSFIQMGDQQEYDEMNAQEFTEDSIKNTLAYIDNIISVEPIMFTYSRGEGGAFAWNYELGYLICKCVSENQMEKYCAFTTDEYTAYIDSDAEFEFDADWIQSYGSGSRLSGELGIKYFESPIVIYGVVKNADEFAEGMSDTTGELFMVFHHVSG